MEDSDGNVTEKQFAYNVLKIFGRNLLRMIKRRKSLFKQIN